MIIHASKDFEKRFKCDVSMKGQTVLQAGRLDAWSAHYFRVGRTPVVMFMNDASLYSFLIPATGLGKFQQVLEILLNRIASLWRQIGVPFDPFNQSFMVLPRSNRSLISSMNEAIRCIRGRYEFRDDERRGINWTEYEVMNNRMPFKAIEYNSPDRLLPALLKDAG